MTIRHATSDANGTSPSRLVGSDRVLNVLTELSNYPNGIGLDDMAKVVRSPKATVHRALASLCRAGLASRDGRGHYILGDEFLRMAFSHHESRPDHVRVQPVLVQLADRYGETVHYAVLDSNSIIYRSKVDPTGGSIRLTSTIGGRNPAHCTAIGKLLLSKQLLDLAAVEQWVGERTLPARTSNTLTTPEALHEEFVRIRSVGYATDDEENELGVNCLAVPYYFSSPAVAVGAVSISALVYRTPLSKLVDDVETIRAIVDGRFESTSP